MGKVGVFTHFFFENIDEKQTKTCAVLRSDNAPYALSILRLFDEITFVLNASLPDLTSMRQQIFHLLTLFRAGSERFNSGGGAFSAPFGYKKPHIGATNCKRHLIVR